MKWHQKIGVFVWAQVILMGELQAQEEVPPVLPPSSELVQRLIALEEEIRQDTVSVAMILKGEVRCEGNFTCQNTVRVLVILPVNEEGRRVRRVQEKIFLWSEEWGWFAYQELALRGGEAIRVFSERRGLIEIR